MNIMRKYIVLLSLIIVASCGKKDVYSEEVVGNAAKQYYSYLLEGNYEAFVDGCYQKDTIRKEYRDQLVDNAKMFVGQQKMEHKGIKIYDVTSVKVDTVSHTANVFMKLSFGDNTTAQVVLPMVEKDELWYMR